MVYLLLAIRFLLFSVALQVLNFAAEKLLMYLVRSIKRKLKQ